MVSQPRNGGHPLLRPDPLPLRPPEAAPRALQPRLRDQGVREQAVVPTAPQAEGLPRHHGAQVGGVPLVGGR